MDRAGDSFTWRAWIDADNAQVSKLALLERRHGKRRRGGGRIQIASNPHVARKPRADRRGTNVSINELRVTRKRVLALVKSDVDVVRIILEYDAPVAGCSLNIRAAWTNQSSGIVRQC